MIMLVFNVYGASHHNDVTGGSGGHRKKIVMAEYKMASGEGLTDADIERISREFEDGSWEGHLERIHQGPAAVSDDPLVAVMVKVPGSMVDAIDHKSSNRSDSSSSR